MSGSGKWASRSCWWIRREVHKEKPQGFVLSKMDGVSVHKEGSRFAGNTVWGSLLVQDMSPGIP